jgi:hypothetical protein
VLAPCARWRRHVVRYCPLAATESNGRPGPRPRSARIPTAVRARTWPALMRRVFALDVRARPCCGGRLRVIAIVQDPTPCAPCSAISTAPQAPTHPGRLPCPGRIA